MRRQYFGRVPEEFNFDEMVDLEINKNKTMEKSKWDFVYSPVFWQLFLVGIAAGLNFPFPGNPWVQGLSTMIGVWFGGSVGVNTINKYSEKKVEVAEIEAKSSSTTTTVSMPSTVSSVTTKTEGV